FRGLPLAVLPTTRPRPAHSAESRSDGQRDPDDWRGLHRPGGVAGPGDRFPLRRCVRAPVALLDASHPACRPLPGAHGRERERPRWRYWLFLRHALHVGHRLPRGEGRLRSAGRGGRLPRPGGCRVRLELASPTCGEPGMIAAREQAALLVAAAERLGLARERLRWVWAPYRVCLLGAHVDHQLGRVAAMAIDRGTLLAFAPSDAAEVTLTSLDYPGSVRFRLDAIPPRRQGDWGDYARGAALALARSYAPLSRGLVGVVSGAGSEGGLASSASVGLAYLLALATANGGALSAAELVRLDQAIENGYFGLANGILDPASIAFSQRDQLTTLDCRAFAAAVPPPSSPDAPGIALLPRPRALEPFVVLVAGSGVSQAIVATNYNRRVAECREAARTLLTAVGRPDGEPVLG